MNIKAKEIAEAIEEFAPLSTQSGWDNSGFSVGDPCATVHKGLVALNCTKEVIEEAIEQGCDIVITHHPLIVHDPCNNILAGDVRGEAIAAAIRGGITIYSSHTPLDKAVGGLNDLMARLLELTETQPLEEGGFGTIGILRKPLSAADFIDYVKRAFCAKNIRCSKPFDGEIKKVAVSSGGGQGSLRVAIERGAQALVTGDVSHHNFYVPPRFMILDVGHHESEYPAIALLTSIIKKKFSKFALLQSKRDISPIYYY